MESRLEKAIKKLTELGLIDSFIENKLEQAYVEQLKKEALERFGKEWNVEMFDYSGLNSEVADFIMRVGCELFMYLKSSDTLFWRGIPIYKQGKWAERVKERVKVDHVGVDYSTWSGNVFFGFSFKGSQDIDKSGIGKFLASQLEKHLNGEI